MDTLANLRDYVKDELGSDIVTLLGANVDADILRYLNEGQRRLGWYAERYTTLTWDAGDASVALPSGFCEVDTLEPDSGVRVSRYRIWNGTLYFLDPNGAAQSGTARLFYLGHVADLAADADITEIPEVGDGAIVSFSCYRAYKRIASSRADYTRYSTVMQANGVEIQDLASLSDQYYADFLEGKEALPLRNSSTFYGE